MLLLRGGDRACVVEDGEEVAAVVVWAALAESTIVASGAVPFVLVRCYWT